MTLYEAVAVASQGQIDRVLGVGGPAPDEALAVEVLEVASGLVVVPAVPVAGQIVQGDSPKRRNFGEGLEAKTGSATGALRSMRRYLYRSSKHECRAWRSDAAVRPTASNEEC